MGYRCHVCGRQHDERPTCFGAEMPAVVAEMPEIERRRRVRLGSDQCILDARHFFILGNLDVPIRGGSEFLRWTVWSTLSEASFGRSSQVWETVGREQEPAYFGWLANQIPGYPPSLNIQTAVQTGPVGIRPTLRIVEEGHPLAVDQQQGVTEARADELIHAALHGG